MDEKAKNAPDAKLHNKQGNGTDNFSAFPPVTKRKMPPIARTTAATSLFFGHRRNLKASKHITMAGQVY